MKTRFAPSPTGYLHIGSARTALFAWLWAQKKQSTLILRIEDTDKKRSTEDYTKAIITSMNWLGIEYDGPYYQTARIDRYKTVIKSLVDNNKAYYCECSYERLQLLRNDLIAQNKKPKYDGRCRHKKLTTGVVRFCNPSDNSVTFCDLIKGNITINNSELDDLIIARSDGLPTYNLTVVVDDHDMQIDYVIRGDDHISNTPRQINLYKALNWDLPEFAHLPIILGSDKARLSKRHGALDIMEYRNKGFLAAALLNYLARLGWSHKDQEIFSIKDMVSLFDIKNVNKSAAIFNEDKLLWLNQQYIKNSNIKSLIKELNWHLKNQKINTSDGANIEKVVKYLQQRSKTLSQMAADSKMFYHDFPAFDEELAKKEFTHSTKTIIVALINGLSTIDNWLADNINKIIKGICKQQDINFAKVGAPFRLALSGNGRAGNIGIVAELVGKKRTLARLNMALDYINKKNN